MSKHALICLGCFALVLAAQAGDDELGKAVKKVAAADSYRFNVQQGTAKTAVEAKFQKNTPLYCKADGIEFFRKGDILVYKDGGAWQHTRTGTLSDPLRILGPSAKVRAIRLPHEELAILGKALTNVKQVDAKNTITFSGDFAEETAQKLARTEDRDTARSGRATLRIDNGMLVEYSIDIRVQGKRGNVEVNGTITKTVTLADVGSTKVDIPDAAKKALE
jgi:hypothetical protein